MDCTKRSDFIIKFKEKINFKVDTDMNGTLGYGTPEEIFRYFPKPNTKEKEDDKEFLSPSFVDDHDILSRIGLNYDLYITFEFMKRFKLKFEMFAPPKQTPTTTTKTVESTLETSTTTVESTLETSTTTVESTLETSTTEKDPKRVRKAKTKVKPKQKSRWGVDNWANNMLREAKLSEADVEEV